METPVLLRIPLDRRISGAHDVSLTITIKQLGWRLKLLVTSGVHELDSTLSRESNRRHMSTKAQSLSFHFFS
jgi:hypothetical protein